MAQERKNAASGRSSALAGGRSTRNRGVLLREKSPFMLREAYKALRTNVSFSMPGSEAKCIGISSSNRGEGKSTNSINLAIAYAQIGKKVILIDCDLRLPTAASKLGISGRPGLSDFLIGEAAWGEVLRPNVEGVDVLPAGTIPVDPTGLLESRQIEDLLQRLRERYDYVLVDLPPVNAVTDAAIMSRCIDGFLLVVRHEETHYKEIAEMLRQLKIAGARVLGFLYNDAPVNGKRYYYKKYYGKAR